MIDQNTYDKYLKERYEIQVSWYDEKSINNQRLSRAFKIAIILFSAITPILAALELKWPTIISSGFVAAMVGILQYYKFEELWHNYRTTCETLKKEKVLFNNKINPYDKADDPRGLFIERAESLISKENTMWVQIVSKKDKKENKG